MQLIKKTLIVGFLLVLASAGVFAMYNRGAFNNIQLDQTAAFGAFFENQVRPRLPGQLADLFPKSNPGPALTITTNSTATDSATTTEVSLNPTDAQSQISTLTNRSQEVGSEISKVLGDYVQVNEEDENKPLHEKAFEHGQYLYCLQVIKEYESNTPTTTANPAP